MQEHQQSDNERNRLYRNRVNFSDRQSDSQQDSRSEDFDEEKNPNYQSMYKFQNQNLKNTEDFYDSKKKRKMNDAPKIQQSWEVYSYNQETERIVKETVYCRTIAWIMFRQDKDKINAWCRICGMRKRARQGNTTNLLHHVNQQHHLLKEMLDVKMSTRQIYPHNIVNLCESVTIKLKNNTVQIQEKQGGSEENSEDQKFFKMRNLSVVQQGPDHFPRKRRKRTAKQSNSQKTFSRTQKNPSSLRHRDEKYNQNIPSYNEQQQLDRKKRRTNSHGSYDDRKPRARSRRNNSYQKPQYFNDYKQQESDQQARYTKHDIYDSQSLSQEIHKKSRSAYPQAVANPIVSHHKNRPRGSAHRRITNAKNKSHNQYNYEKNQQQPQSLGYHQPSEELPYNISKKQPISRNRNPKADRGTDNTKQILPKNTTKLNYPSQRLINKQTKQHLAGYTNGLTYIPHKNIQMQKQKPYDHRNIRQADYHVQYNESQQLYGNIDSVLAKNTGNSVNNNNIGNSIATTNNNTANIQYQQQTNHPHYGRLPTYNTQFKLQSNNAARIHTQLQLQNPEQKDNRTLQQLRNNPQIQIIKFQQNKQLASLTFITKTMKQNLLHYGDCLSFWHYTRPIKLNQIESVIYVCGQNKSALPALFGIVVVFKETQPNYTAIYTNFYQRIQKARQIRIKKYILCGPTFMAKYFHSFQRKLAQRYLPKVVVDNKLLDLLIRNQDQIDYIYIRQSIFKSRSASAKKFILARAIVVEVLANYHKNKQFIGFFVTPTFVEKLCSLTPLHFGTQVNLTDFLTKIFQSQKQAMSSHTNNQSIIANTTLNANLHSNINLNMNIFNQSQRNKLRSYKHIAHYQKRLSRQIFMKLCYSLLYCQYSLHIISDDIKVCGAIQDPDSNNDSSHIIQVREISKNTPFNHTKISYKIKYEQIIESRQKFQWKWTCQCSILKCTLFPCPHLLKVLVSRKRNIIQYISQRWILNNYQTNTSKAKNITVNSTVNINRQPIQQQDCNMPQNNPQIKLQGTQHKSHNDEQNMVANDQDQNESKQNQQQSDDHQDFNQIQYQYLGAISEDKFMQLFWA